MEPEATFPVALSSGAPERSLRRTFTRLDVGAYSQIGDGTLVIVPPGKRKETAQAAYRAGDVELTVAAHEIPAELHTQESGQYVKAIVFGGLDGIITTFAVVASTQGANLGPEIVIIMGFANLLADGVSMGFGEFLSEQSEVEYGRMEREREKFEFENVKDAEIQEMVDLYQEAGIEEEDAKTILNTMSKYKDFFIDHMMVHELGILPPPADASPLKNGIVIFCAFLCFGLIPLLAYVALSPISFSGFDPTFLLSCILTAIALFTLGAIKSKFSQQHWLKSALWVMLNGGVAAGVAYLVGYVLQFIVDVENC